MKGVKGGKEFPTEFSGKNFCGNKEPLPADPELSVPGEPTPGNNTVDVGMEVKLLPPGMEDLYDAWGGPQKLLVRREFQKGLCRTFVEKGI